MAKVLNGELPPRPRTMDISLAEVAERCMKKKPEDRLTMANVIAYFKQDLQTYIPDSPCFYLKAKKPCRCPFSVEALMSLTFLQSMLKDGARLGCPSKRGPIWRS
jgi:hypothetical protein